MHALPGLAGQTLRIRIAANAYKSSLQLLISVRHRALDLFTAYSSQCGRSHLQLCSLHISARFPGGLL